jgi:ABC-type sugar transport system substrate-binding protein
MGYRGVYSMDKVLKGEKVEPRIVAIPAQVVTKENFNDPKIQELLKQ